MSVPMKIDDLLTFPQAAEAMGTTNTRAAYRAVERALAAGHDVTIEALGKTLIKRDAIPILKQFFYPYYSDAHQKMVKEWGRRGGTAAGVTKRKRNKAGG